MAFSVEPESTCVNNMSEVTKFLEEINDGGNAFEETTAPIETAAETVEEKVVEKVPYHKDERFSQTRKELRESREMIAELKQTVEQLKGQTQTQTPSNSDSFESDWLETYGDSPESRSQLKFFAKYLSGLDERAAEKAMIKFKAESEAQKTQAQQEEERWNYQVQSQLEALEDEFGIDLTSSQAVSKRADFLSFLQDISPKDNDGNIIQYAPMDKAFPLWQKQSIKDNTERKEIATRSMDKTNTETPKTFKAVGYKNATWKDWARENGVLPN